MKVVLDCRSVFPGMGGIGRATAALARHLPAQLPQDELVLLVGARRFDAPLAAGPNITETRVDAPMLDPAFEQVRLPGLLEELGADCFHGTCFLTPIAASAVARVATVHDVVFRRHPELVEAGLREYLDRWTRVSCELADAVVTVSEFSRREIAALYGRRRSRVHVVPNAVDERFLGLERQAPKGPPFLLYVGTIEPKKNVHLLLRAFDELVRLDPALPHRLVLAGGAGSAPFDLEAALAQLEARERVHVLGHVSDEALRGLYASADLFCYLSEYEGFGLPVVEAMAAGTPCVVSDRASLPEVAGDAAVVVDPTDPAFVARALHGVLADPARAAALRERGRERARRFSWATSAARLAAVYRRAVARAARRRADASPDAGRPALRVLKGRGA